MDPIFMHENHLNNDLENVYGVFQSRSTTSFKFNNNHILACSNKYSSISPKLKNNI